MRIYIRRELQESPDGLERSSAGILINTRAIKVHLDKEKFAKQMDLLQKRTVIAYTDLQN